MENLVIQSFLLQPYGTGGVGVGGPYRLYVRSMYVTDLLEWL